MGNQSQDQRQGFNSSVSWSPDEESTFLDMLVEEFISKQPEAMDALIALVLFRISKINDEGWNRVAIRLTERIGKKYTMMELKEQMKRFTQRFHCMENLFGQDGPGMNFPPTTFEPYSEVGNDTRVSKSPDENVPSPKKDAINSDGCNVSVPSGDCDRNSNRSSDNDSIQEGDFGMDSPGITFEQSFERGNDAGISTPEKDAINSDGCNVSVPYPGDCDQKSDRSSDNDSIQEGDLGMDSPGTTFEQSFEHENDAGISRSPDENILIPEKEGRIFYECNDNIRYPEESVRNSDKNCVNASFQERGPGLDFPCATFGTYFEHDNDAEVYWTPDVSHQEDGSGIDSFRATPEPYSEHYNDSEVYWTPDENFPYSNRSSDSVPRQDGGPGIRMSPAEKFSIHEKEGRNYDGCNGSVPIKRCGNVTHQEGGLGTSFPRTELEPSDEHDSDAGICQSPVESVSTLEKDSRNYGGCSDNFPCPEESVRNSNRSCDDILHPQEDIVDSVVNPNVSCPRERGNAENNVEDSGVNNNATAKTGESEGSRSSDAEKNCGDSTECEVSSPSVNVVSVNQWNDDPASGQEENATSSTPRYEDFHTPESMGCNKRPAADPLNSSDYKRNKWSSYSQAENTRVDNQNSDDGDSFSFARCRNILHGMRRINSRFRDAALEFLEDEPYYRKFFMQMKYDKRLDWLSSILGMEH